MEPPPADTHTMLVAAGYLAQGKAIEWVAARTGLSIADVTGISRRTRSVQ